ncbi:MAG: hypothetical protein ABIN79_06070 [Marmoricola sp.]
MSMTRLRTNVAGGTAVLVALAVAISGCSVTRDDEPAGQEGTASAEPTATPSPTATVTVTESATPSESSSPTGPDAQLLSAAEFPQLNDSSPWTETATSEGGTESFGLCQKFDLLSIGATGLIERSLDSGGSGSSAATAGQQVAEFADSQTAVRAMKVVRSWHDDCASRIEGKNVKVREITAVTLSEGTGWHYLVSYVRGGKGNFHSLGLVRNGTRLTLLRLDHAGQDHNYDPGQDPMELAVQAAAAKLAG